MNLKYIKLKERKGQKKESSFKIQLVKYIVNGK